MYFIRFVYAVRHSGGRPDYGKKVNDKDKDFG